MTPARTVNWAHPVACCLVAVTGVLLTFGAMVTTYEAAMAVPDWPATYGHNMFLFPWAEWFYGPWDLFLEHGHRLLGALVGLITLALAAIVWRTSQPTAVRSLAVAAVVLVVVQGGLGGLRVLLDDKTIAKGHACTGPLFFAVAVALATLTSRVGQRADMSRLTGQGGLAAWLTRLLLLAAYVQLVAGAQLRHLDAAVGPATFRWLVVLHLIGALAVTVLSLAAAAEAFGWIGTGTSTGTGRRWWAAGIVGLVSGQVVLGCAAWVVSWGLPLGLLPDRLAAAFPEPSAVVVARSGGSAAIVTGHVLLGMLILASSVVLCIVSGGLSQAADVRLPAGRRAVA